MAFTVACPSCFKPNKYKGHTTELRVECSGCKQTFVPTPDLHFGIQKQSSISVWKLAALVALLTAAVVAVYWFWPLLEQVWDEFAGR